MDDALAIQIPLFLGLLALSAFFSGSETAFFSLSRWRILYLVRKGMPGALRLERLRAQPKRLLLTILLGNNLVNIAATALMERGLEHRLGARAVPVSIAVMTVVVLILGEILPKSVAARRPEGVTRMAGRPIEWLARISWPVRGVVRFASTGVLRLLGAREEPRREGITEAQFLAALHQVVQEELLQETEGQILERVFSLKETPIHEIMVPRTRMVSLPHTATLEEAVEAVQRSGHSRIPVYRQDREDVIGVLYAKDLLHRELEETEGVVIAEWLREPLFVPAGLKAQDLLRKLRQRRLQIALVVDEHGGLDGLVTLEDVLELVVGDIFDESDRLARYFFPRQDGAIDVFGRTPVERFQERFECELPGGEAQTVGGRILEMLGRLPEEDQVLELPPYRIRVVRVQGARVVRLRVEGSP